MQSHGDGFCSAQASAGKAACRWEGIDRIVGPKPKDAESIKSIQGSKVSKKYRKSIESAIPSFLVLFGVRSSSVSVESVESVESGSPAGTIQKPQHPEPRL